MSRITSSQPREVFVSDENSIGTIANIRTPEYLEHARNTIARGICPLCQLDSKLNRVIRESEHWRMWHNPFAYAHHKHHIMLAPKIHVTDICAITAEMWAQHGEMIAWAVRELKIPGGGTVMRFGDSNYSASSLNHLHAQIQVPDLTGPAFAVFCKSGFSAEIVSKSGD